MSPYIAHIRERIKEKIYTIERGRYKERRERDGNLAYSKKLRMGRKDRKGRTE
jgi:hypothetical protein